MVEADFLKLGKDNAGIVSGAFVFLVTLSTIALDGRENSSWRRLVLSESSDCDSSTVRTFLENFPKLSPTEQSPQGRLRLLFSRPPSEVHVW